MRVGCQRCGAAYSVADEKVTGRKLKLSCKKCGEPMVIDGSEQGLADGSMPFDAKLPIASAAASDAEWYVASNDAAQGPYTQHEVQAHYAAGLIAPDTLVFRDGLDGWTAASEVLAPQAQREAHRAQPVHAPQRVSTPPAALARAVPMGRDPFSDDSAQPLSPRLATSDLLAQGPQREGTVQFSLDEIRALSALSTPSSSGALPAPKAGHDDDSGLIDVRSLSEAATSPDPFQPIGHLQASPLDTMAPFALPTRARNGGIDFRTKVLAGVASFGFLLVGAIGVFALTRSQQPYPSAAPVAAAMALPQPSAAAREIAIEETELKPASVVVGEREARSNAIEETELKPASVVVGEREARSNRARQRGTRRDARVEPSERESAKPARGSDIDAILGKAKESEKKPGGSSKGGDDIDSLLLGALSGKKSPPKPEPAPASSLAKTPSRDQVLAALGKGKAKTRAAKCKGPGIATAAITIAGSGRVSSVSVSGVDGSAKSCVESAVRSTSFPKFQQDSFAVKFPFKLGG
jgi:hypothetical protein